MKLAPLAGNAYIQTAFLEDLTRLVSGRQGPLGRPRKRGKFQASKAPGIYVDYLDSEGVAQTLFKIVELKVGERIMLPDGYVYFANVHAFLSTIPIFPVHTLDPKWHDAIIVRRETPLTFRSRSGTKTTLSKSLLSYLR